MKTITVTSITITPGTPDTIQIEGTLTEIAPTAPAQQVTVENRSSVYPNYSRALRLTDQLISCFRYGANAVGLLVSSFAEIAVAIEPTLTFAPVVTYQPINQTVATAAPASFVTAGASELAMTYGWHESTDAGATWSESALTTGTVGGVAYDVSTPGTLVVTPNNVSQSGRLYRCTLTNSRGSADSKPAKLTVTA